MEWNDSGRIATEVVETQLHRTRDSRRIVLSKAKSAGDRDIGRLDDALILPRGLVAGFNITWVLPQLGQQFQIIHDCAAMPRTRLLQRQTEFVACRNAIE